MSSLQQIRSVWNPWPATTPVHQFGRSLYLRNETQHPNGPHVTPRALAAAIAIRTGSVLPGELQLTEFERAEANVMAGRSLGKLMREACLIEGIEPDAHEGHCIRSAVSGFVAANAFGTSVEAQLVNAFHDARDTTDWCPYVPIQSFKQQDRIRQQHTADESMGQPLPRGMTADHYHIETHETESYRAYRWGKQFVADEQDILDDNVELFRTLPTTLGQSAARLRPDLVYYALLSNPTMADGNAFISAAHGNNGSAAFGSTNLGAAIAAMRVKTEDGIPLDLDPQYLVVAPALEETARIVLFDRWNVADFDLQSTRFRGLQLRVESRLQNGVTDPITGTTVAGSSTAWFLVAANTTPIEVGLLTPQPVMRRFVLDEGQWGLGWDVQWSLGVKPVDWHGIYQGNS